MAKTTRKNLLRTIEELRWDLWLAATAIGLTLFGVIMVYSASAGDQKSERVFVRTDSVGGAGIDRDAHSAAR